MGKIGGTLASVRPDDLLSFLISDFIKSNSFNDNLIDDVIVGCSNQAGEDNRNIARMSSLLAKLPFDIPATTINRLCGSSMDAAIYAISKIKSHLADCILVGGVESMSRSPLVIAKSSVGYARDYKMYDSTFGWRFPNKKMRELFPLLSMGETAEEVAKIYKIKREEQDLFALKSHEKAIKAWNSNQFDNEIIPVNIIDKKNNKTVINRDEGPRDDTNMEKLSKLKPVFKKEGTVTAGNASTMNDGAALLLIVSEDFLKKYNLNPIVEIVSGVVCGLHPSTMGMGPVKASKLLSKKQGINIDKFDVIELNEAFASQSLACIKELKLDPNKVNKNGGAIALGHPLGCSGARIICTLAHIMDKDKSLSNALATMCIGVGQGIAVSLKQIQ